MKTLLTVAKHEVLDLVRRGSNLGAAIKQVVITSRDRNMLDIMGADTPPSPVILRRKSQIPQIIASHQASVERNSTAPRRSSFSINDSLLVAAPSPKNQRKSKSVYL